MTPTWQTLARGRIPVWPGCIAVFPDDPHMGRVHVTRLSGDRVHGVFVVQGDNPSTVDTLAGDLCPDLRDPPTQHAYLREIAIIHGAPPDAVAEGVRFYQQRKGDYWTLDAGAPHGMRPARWSVVFRGERRIDTDDRVEALVRAWPA